MEKLTDLASQIQSGIVPYGATIRRVIAAEVTAAQKSGAEQPPFPFIVFAQADGVPEQEIGVSIVIANRLKPYVGRAAVEAPPAPVEEVAAPAEAPVDEAIELA